MTLISAFSPFVKGKGWWNIIRFSNSDFIQKKVWYVKHYPQLLFSSKITTMRRILSHTIQKQQTENLPWTLVGENSLKLLILKGSWVFTSMCYGIRTYVILHLISFL